MKKTTRLRLLLTFLTMPFLVVLCLNVGQLAEKYGYDLLLTELVSAQDNAVVRLVAPWIPLALYPAVGLTAFGVVMFTFGIWGDALLCRGDITKREKIQDFGETCMRLSDYIKTADISTDLRVFADNVWSRYLPIFYELERLNFKVPNVAVVSKKDILEIGRYLQFVGPLLLDLKIKEAKAVAKYLCEQGTAEKEDPSHLSLQEAG